MLNPPNLPLRAGPSGPPVDWLYWLRNLTGFAGFKRLWFNEQVGLTVDVPESTPATPGVEQIAVDVEWTADDVSLTGQMAYFVLARWAWINTAAPAAYPGAIVCNLNADPAGGSTAILKSLTGTTVPTNPGGDFNCAGDVTSFRLMGIGDYPTFAQGTNRFWLGVGNPNPAQAIRAQSCQLLVAEMATPPGNLIILP
jgi:hypothetical protein